MMRDKSPHGTVLRDASVGLVSAAIFAVLTAGACSNASVIGDGEGGAAGGQVFPGGGGGGTTGGPGGMGGFFLSYDAFPVGDAGPDRPSGGTCGDGIIERSEQCDDGNTTNGDGCSRLCQIEANWVCPEEGKPCKYVGNCGSGVLTSNKVCDDGNDKSGDGCSGDCQTVEPGYICRVPGKPCTTRCGDGLLRAFETCDDGNTVSGDGCSATCKVEPGFDCGKDSPSKCKATVCGNKVKETGETCDDGNTLPYDGCASNCQSEPKCGTDSSAVGACKSTCGDGILWPGIEDCDDGNGADGDGCSKDCKVEPGWTCKSSFDDPPPKLTIPVISRDFMWFEQNGTGTGHPDFGHYCCDDSMQKAKGIVRSTLDPTEHKPVWAWSGGDSVADPTQVLFTNKTNFNQWYRDVSGTNMTYYQTLTLLQNATAKTTYAMNSDTDPPWFDLCGFFPLDDLSKPIVDQNTKLPVTYTDSGYPGRTCHAYQGLGFGNSWASHNYSFTTELRYWFQYRGTEKLTFTGDDDVWVFINGTLAVEMPGIHNRREGIATLDASKGTVQTTYTDNTSLNTTVDLKMTIGSVYEVVVFQAERWCCGSNYMLTLANFIGGKTTCVPTCGDGVTVADEECDCGDGKVAAPAGCPGPNNDTSYGGCSTQCKWGPFCGDATVQGPPGGPEECDLGKQNGDTSVGDDWCSLSCQKPRRCGDGHLDTTLGEKCDFGPNNGVKLDSNLQPTSDPNDPKGVVYCTTDCEIPDGVIY